jgi:hypothetical protein
MHLKLKYNIYKPVLLQADVSLYGQGLEAFHQKFHESHVISNGPKQLANGFHKVWENI